MGPARQEGLARKVVKAHQVQWALQDPPGQLVLLAPQEPPGLRDQLDHKDLQDPLDLQVLGKDHQVAQARKDLQDHVVHKDRLVLHSALVMVDLRKI